MCLNVFSPFKKLVTAALLSGGALVLRIKLFDFFLLLDGPSFFRFLLFLWFVIFAHGWPSCVPCESESWRDDLTGSSTEGSQTTLPQINSELLLLPISSNFSLLWGCLLVDTRGMMNCKTMHHGFDRRACDCCENVHVFWINICSKPNAASAWKNNSLSFGKLNIVFPKTFTKVIPLQNKVQWILATIQSTQWLKKSLFFLINALLQKRHSVLKFLTKNDVTCHTNYDYNNSTKQIGS